MAYILIAHIVMAYATLREPHEAKYLWLDIVMANILIAHIVMAYATFCEPCRQTFIVMANIVMAYAAFREPRLVKSFLQDRGRADGEAPWSLRSKGASPFHS